jgi:Fic family protein
MLTMESILLKHPSYKKYPQTALIEKYFNDGTDKLQPYIDSINSPNYLYWTKAMYKPTLEGYTSQEAWLTARVVRRITAIKSPITDVSSAVYSYIKLAHFDKILHHIDLQIGGKLLVNGGTGEDRQKFLSRGIIEEAIASSQLEGASTTRKYAKKMIAENRKPKSISEKMIFNNYVTMNAIENEYKEHDLSIELLMEMHVSLTNETLEDPEDVGKLREEGDLINVIYRDKIAHVTPPRSFVDQELPKLIEYANDDKEFIHPIIKASTLHFWIGYLHPFADGNGRLARSLFYWYLFKNDYWGMAFVPISMVLKRAQKQYTYAYIQSEQDGRDLTYFIDFSINRLDKALQEFDEYVNDLQNENKLIDKRLKGRLLLNDRQKQVVYYVTKDEINYTTESSHKTLNGIARNTAKSDLSKLVDDDLLNPIRDGKQVKYFASTKLKQLILGDTNPYFREAADISDRATYYI